MIILHKLHIERLKSESNCKLCRYQVEKKKQNKQKLVLFLNHMALITIFNNTSLGAIIYAL